MFAKSVMLLTSMARPSTTPARNVNAGFALAYTVSAFARATGSVVVYASEHIPFRSFKTASDGVPSDAFSAMLFLITR